MQAIGFGRAARGQGGTAFGRVARRAGLAGVLLVAVAGCAKRQPSASLSHPAVFTTLHLRAAETSLAGSGGTRGGVRGDMDRYLRTSASTYDANRLRIDAMLDTNQQTRAIAQAVLSQFSLELNLLKSGIGGNGLPMPDEIPGPVEPSDPVDPAAAAADGDTPGGDGTPAPNGAPDGDAAASAQQRMAALETSIKRLMNRLDAFEAINAAAATDSPFDMVDRAHDLYTTALHKSLRGFGVDSHLLPVGGTERLLYASEDLAAAHATLAAAEAELARVIAAQKPPSPKVGQEALLRVTQQMVTGTASPAAPPSNPGAPSGASGSSPSGGTASAPPAPSSPGTPPTVVNTTTVATGTPPPSVSGFGALSQQPDVPPRGTPGTPPPADTPTQADINRLAKEAAEAQKAAEEARVKAEEARLKSETKRDEAAAKELETAKARLKVLEEEAKLKKLALEEAEQKHDHALTWYTKLEGVAAAADAPRAENPAIRAATDRVTAAKHKVQRKTDAYNEAVSQARQNPTAYGELPGDGGTPTCGQQRLVVLLLQAHVHRGLAANTMVGVRAQLTEVESNKACTCPKKTCACSGGSTAGKDKPCTCSALCPSDVRTIRLHPTRNYDREDAAFAELISEQLMLDVAGRMSSEVEAGLARQMASEAAEKRRFLSRIPKLASWADAGTNTFGWDFYPSNPTIRRRGPLKRSAGIVYGPAGRQYEIVAHLDPGARDCAAYLIVPACATSLTFQLSTETARLDYALSTIKVRDDGMPTRADKDGRIMKVPLPPYSAAEQRVMLGTVVGDATGAVPTSEVPVHNRGDGR